MTRGYAPLMRGAFSAGSWLLLLVLGCAGATTRSPDGSPNSGGTGAGGSPDSEPGGSSPTPAVGSAGEPGECACLVEEIAWWRDGGLVPSSIEGHLTPCAQFEYTETTGEPVAHRFCWATLELCSDAYGPDDVNDAIAHPDVQAALARAPILFGADSRDLDGHVDHIEVGGKVIELGAPCGAPEQAAHCEIPKGVENLDKLLGYIQLQQHVGTVCKAK